MKTNTTFRRWFTGITRTWLVLLLGLPTINAAQLSTSNGVVVSKIGKAYMYIFPGDSVKEPMGKLQAGDTIEVDYWLRITGHKPRFISLDASQASRLRPGIVQGHPNAPSRWAGGFYVRSTRQGRLEVVISQKLWQKVKDQPTQNQVRALEETFSKEANLSVSIERVKKQYRIKSVTIE